MGHRVSKRVIEGVVFGMVLFVSSVAWGAHPLITDDAETQGKGKFQVEVNGQYDSDKETSNGVTAESTGAQVMTILSYGLTENADLVLSLPYQWGKVKEDGVTVYDEKGISDTTLEVKWRFFEKDGLMLALKPGVIFPTGNESKGPRRREDRVPGVFHRDEGGRALGVPCECGLHREREQGG